MSRRSVSRRRFLHQSAGLMLGAGAFGQSTKTLGSEARRPKVAVVFTVFHAKSHAHVFLENFLVPYLFNGSWTDSGVDVVSFYGDQFPDNDISRQVSRQFGIPIYETIDKALCLGGKELAVDAVLSIAEHGDYPINDLHQKEYPRKRFFDEIVAVMRRSNRYVPLFNDKHLSYRWEWAKQMYDTARELGIPLMAGSSVPLAQRRPPFELPKDALIEEAVSIHGGGLESYDFHGLELLASIVEARKGGESGVTSVEFLEGEALWQAGEEGRWSMALAKAAMAAELGRDPGPLREIPARSHGIVLTYRDGLKASMLCFGGNGTRWNFSCRLAGDSGIMATNFHTGPWGNRNLFPAFSHAIQDHCIHERSPYPVERTLLTTGILEAALRSRKAQALLQTPYLEFAYSPRDFTAMREMGSTWKIITAKTPEPTGIETVKIEN